MNREDIIRMAQETGVTAERVRDLVNFAALVASAEREECERGYLRLQSLMEIRETQPNKPCCLAEREACAKIGDDHPSWSSRMYSATIRARGQA